jgi:hypothetical protein
MPHISALDFVLWPAFREYAVQILEMQERMGWLLDMSSNVHCDWYFATEKCFQRDDETGMLDLCDSAKVSSSLFAPCDMDGNRLHLADDIRHL